MNLKYTLVFSAGFISCVLLFYIFSILNLNIPLTGLTIKENLSPSNRITNDDILVYNDKIVLKIPNITISNYADTGSMKPFLDENTNGIKIVPKSPSDIQVGDIISFRSSGKLIVHRVIEKGIDEKGVYFLTKGDNNQLNDGKVRFEDVEYITIGVLW
ncbi:MAG: signal peptidase I [Candidatus Pacearchaeota archaeon]